MNSTTIVAGQLNAYLKDKLEEHAIKRSLFRVLVTQESKPFVKDKQDMTLKGVWYSVLWIKT